jgi:hypothetical protein
MSLMSKAARFARSPQGRALMERGKVMAKDPETKRKIERVRSQIAKKGR